MKQNFAGFAEISNYFNKIGNDRLSESFKKFKDFIRDEDLIKILYDSKNQRPERFFAFQKLWPNQSIQDA